MSIGDDNATISDWIPCNTNWTGPVIGGSPLFGPSTAIGYVATLISVLIYGCAFVPLKFAPTADGFFSQWVMSIGIWQVGLVIQLIRGVPQFYPLVLVNGLVWVAGNCCVGPILNLIGLALGMLFWNCTNILLGWASGSFGFFNVCPAEIGNPIMNYIGVAICMVSAVAYGFVNTESGSIPNWFRGRLNTDEMQLHGSKETNAPCSSLEDVTNRIALNSDPPGVSINPGAEAAATAESKATKTYGTSAELTMTRTPPPAIREALVFLGSWSEKWRRGFGIVLALFSGCCYGVLFISTNYVRDHVVVEGKRASQSGIDYAFTLYSGIFFSSTIVFGGYMLIHKNPHVDRAIILPGLLSGLLWGIATAAFLVANEILSTAVTFPIIGTIPGAISIAFGIFLFKEVSGIRNYIILAVAFSLTVIGVILAALSKVM